MQLEKIVQRDADGQVTRLNLPDHLIVMANHQAYTDWMFLWILACYSGTAEGITILLKASLKHVPFVGWGMVSLTLSKRAIADSQQFFRFIFLKRSWAADRLNLTHSLKRIAQATYERGKRHPLWLVIFPEGTITSDNERAKSLRYAQRESIVSKYCLVLLTCSGRLCGRTAPQVDWTIVLSQNIASRCARSATSGCDDRLPRGALWQISARVVQPDVGIFPFGTTSDRPHTSSPAHESWENGWGRPCAERSEGRRSSDARRNTRIRAMAPWHLGQKGGHARAVVSRTTRAGRASRL